MLDPLFSCYANQIISIDAGTLKVFNDSLYTSKSCTIYIVLFRNLTWLFSPAIPLFPDGPVKTGLETFHTVHTVFKHNIDPNFPYSKCPLPSTCTTIYIQCHLVPSRIYNRLRILTNLPDEGAGDITKTTLLLPTIWKRICRVSPGLGHRRNTRPAEGVGYLAGAVTSRRPNPSPRVSAVYI